MANTLTGKVWSLDTVTGVVSSGPVIIHAIHIRWTTAGAGSCVISTALNTADVILDLKTTAASTAVVFDTTRVYTFGDQCFAGLQKVTSVNIDTIYVITSLPR